MLIEEIGGGDPSKWKEIQSSPDRVVHLVDVSRTFEFRLDIFIAIGLLWVPGVIVPGEDDSISIAKIFLRNLL